VPGAVLVTTPKFALLLLQQIVFGGANWVRLKRLKNSVRNSTAMRSSAPKVVRLKIAKSKLSMLSDRRAASTRDSLPKVKSVGATKHAVSNQPFSLAVALPEVDLWHPATTLGREPAPNNVVSLAWPLLHTKGNPLWNVVTPSIPQPPTNLSMLPFTAARNLLPWPKGKSGT